MKSRRNGVIDLYKFYYSLLIVVFHIYSDTRRHLQGAGTAVEFFMLVAGVFFFRSWEKRKNSIHADRKLGYPMDHLKKRLLRFLPYTTIGYAVGFFVKKIYPGIAGGLTLGSVVDSFVKTVWDIFLVSMNGLNMGNNMVDGPLWSLSAMIIVEFLILCILVIREKHFFYIILPVSLLFGYGYYANMKSVDHLLFTGLTTFGVIRVYFLYCIAYYISTQSHKLADMQIGRKGRVFLTVVEVAMHLCFLVLACKRNTRYYRWFETMLFAVAITITLSGKSYLADWLKQTKLTDFLGKWSMAIYIIHSPIIQFFREKYQEPDIVYSHKYTICLLVVIASLATMAFGKLIIWVGMQIHSSVRQPIECKD